MAKAHEILGFGILIAAGAVVASLMYSGLALTETAAAQKAATCAGWPKEIASQVPEQLRPAQKLDQPMVLLFGRASLVQVRWDGMCSSETVPVISGPLRHLPDMATISAPGQNYVLYFLGGSASKGYRFLAARAGMASLPIPQKPTGQQI